MLPEMLRHYSSFLKRNWSNTTSVSSHGSTTKQVLLGREALVPCLRSLGRGTENETANIIKYIWENSKALHDRIHFPLSLLFLFQRPPHSLKAPIASLLLLLPSFPPICQLKLSTFHSAFSFPAFPAPGKLSLGKV